MKLTEDNFILYAAKHYDFRNSSSEEEFNDDLKRFQYLKRLFKRYEEDDDLKIRLILNHLIVIFNCFGPHATAMLFMKLPEYHKCLKPFVILLGFMPKTIEYDNIVIRDPDIGLDERIVRELREI
jgi:hypothetical protein